MYGYESCATLTTGRLHYKLQTGPLVREGAPRRRAKQLSSKRKEKEKYGHGPQRGVRLTVGHNMNSTQQFKLITFALRNQTRLAVQTGNVALLEKPLAMHLGLHLHRRLTWAKH
jgi:hypothetical protein